MATTSCRYCGYQADPAAPICGNCGQSLAGGHRPDRPLAASSGSLGSPTGPLAGGRGPLGALVRPLVILLGLGAIAALLLAPIRDAIEGVIESVESGDIFGGEAPGGEAPGGVDPGGVDPATQPVAGYDGIRQIAADLRAGGLPCRSVTVDSTSETVESGSCQAQGTHVQMLVYRTSGTLDFALSEIYDDDWPFSYVHDQNWFVTTETSVARKIHRILGGTLTVARGS